MSKTGMVRTSRSRAFIGLGVLMLICTLATVFFYSQQQINEARKIEKRCEHQPEDLEENLELEYKKHDQQERDKQRQKYIQNELNERLVHDVNLKFLTLQQHYKLLKSQHEDFKGECSKLVATQLNKLNAIENRIKQLRRVKDDDIKQWKAKYNQILNGRGILEQKPTQSKNQHDKPSSKKILTIISSGNITNSSTTSTKERQFNSQLSVNEIIYEIPIKYINSKSFDSSKRNANDQVSSRPVEKIGKPNTIGTQIKALQNDQRYAKLPHGVVPFQRNMDAFRQNDQEGNKQIMNNRYVNVVIEKVEDQTNYIGIPNEMQSDVRDDDQTKEKKRIYNILKFGKNRIKDDKAIYHLKKQIMESHIERLNINDDLQVIHQADTGSEENRISVNGDELKNEVNEDQGKAYPDEAFQLEDEDVKFECVKCCHCWFYSRCMAYLDLWTTQLKPLMENIPT